MKSSRVMKRCRHEHDIFLGKTKLPVEGFFCITHIIMRQQNSLTVGIGEAIACCVLGLLLLEVMPRIPALRGRLAVR